MIPEIHLARFRRIAAGFVAAVQSDVIPLTDACNLIEATAHCGKPTRDLSAEQQSDLASYGIQALTDLLFQPAIAARAEIRLAIGPLMQHRKPRAEILIAAYRTANGRLVSGAVEELVTSEIARFMARLRERRHA